jgi:hypothetical protein
MRSLRSTTSLWLLGFLLGSTLSWAVFTRAAERELVLERRATISKGWHPWYEIKVDPENAKNLIVCGTKWDVKRNGPVGFVYFSPDGGTQWESVLEDRSTGWVTEHSCAFGPSHRAYFVSGDSLVVDGIPHHEFGKTTVYVSSDAGGHWMESTTTGWADYSSSAVSARSHRLFTFYNSFDATKEPGRGWGNEIALVIFSPQGKDPRGPFFSSTMRSTGYRAAFPSGAIALKSGAVMALFYGNTRNRNGVDLGIVHADDGERPQLQETFLAHLPTEPCDRSIDNSLAYDRQRNRLFAIYVNGCGDRTELILAVSDDEGKTWSKSALDASDGKFEGFHNPSLEADASGNLWLLWREIGSAKPDEWRFSSIRASTLLLPGKLLSSGPPSHVVSPDALTTFISPPEESSTGQGGVAGDETMTLGTFSEANSVWRSGGLTTAGANVWAIWSLADESGSHLRLATFGERANMNGVLSPPADLKSDVTTESRLLYAYGAAQNFDRQSGVFTVCVSLANRGEKSFEMPLKLKVRELTSELGAITILNATSGGSGVGAEWELRNPVTGDSLPPNTHTHPFCLRFHLDAFPKVREAPGPLDLMRMRLKVFSGGASEKVSH